MEWVETTGKTIEAARESALDQLGVAADEAEFDVLEEPRPGLFGRMRGEARLRARVRPTQVRPKQDRRRRGRGDKASAGNETPSTDAAAPTERTTSGTETPTSSESRSESTNESNTVATSTPPSDDGTTASPTRSGGRTSRGRRSPKPAEEQQMSSEDRVESTVTPDEVGAAAVQFMDGLTAAFGVEASSALRVDDLDLEVAVSGTELGLLVGPGGRTLNAIQDLARVAAQRRLGDHDTRLRIDVAGYRARREAALSDFARDVAEQVRQSGIARSLEPMVSADRKVVHDALNDIDGIVSRSVGDDPDRRIVVEPA